jgi:hypothetical protein
MRLCSICWHENRQAAFFQCGPPIFPFEDDMKKFFGLMMCAVVAFALGCGDKKTEKKEEKKTTTTETTK